MNALFVYKYLGLGGVEAVLSSRLEGLPSLGIDAHAWFLSDGPGRDMFTATPSRLHIGGVHDLQRHLELASPDVVLVLDTEEALPALRDQVPGRAVVIEVHTPYVENRVYLASLGRVRVDAFFTPTKYQASLIRNATRPIAPTLVIPNSLQSDFLSEPSDFSGRTDAPLVAWVGRFDALKNWRQCLRVVERLGKMRVRAELWLVGKGGDEAATRQLVAEAERRQVLGRMRWFAGIDHHRMPRLFDMVRSSGGIVISTSREESFGLSVAEAMVRGCAVVVPARSAFLELVPDGRYGMTYAPESVRAASECAMRLLEDQAYREECGIQARRYVLERHAPSVALPHLADAIRSLVP